MWLWSRDCFKILLAMMQRVARVRQRQLSYLCCYVTQHKTKHRLYIIISCIFYRTRWLHLIWSLGAPDYLHLNSRQSCYMCYRWLRKINVTFCGASVRRPLPASMAAYSAALSSFYPRCASDARVLAIIACLSVCLCVFVCVSHAGVVSKRLNVGSRK